MIRLVKWLSALVVLAMGGVAYGFLTFADVVGGLAPVSTSRADGIVVLTGGQSRVAEGVRLLSQGSAARLLITGAHQDTTKDQLLRALHVIGRPQLFDCCIDIGREARNTIGNAQETRAWVVKHQYKSILVVTSSYHMPRSLIELKNAMPEIELNPYPIMPRNFRSEAWWAYPRTAQLLGAEYVKFAAASMRLKLSRLVGGGDGVGGTDKSASAPTDKP